jgi:sugar phosphate isomerase/epimerase
VKSKFKKLGKMKKAINLYLINGLDTQEKLNAIKRVGYDGVLLSMDNERETMSLNEQIAYCKDIGLGISMIHCKYYEPWLNGLWLDEGDGDLAENFYIKQIQQIKDFKGANFVIHTNGGYDVQNTDIGMQRLKKLLNYCEKYGINLCIENLYSAGQVDYIFANLQSQNLKFCYDSGHENFLTPGFDLAAKHVDRLNVTHLHDNHGKIDEHLVLGEGNIDLNKLAHNLSKCNIEYLTAEIKLGDNFDSYESILKLNLMVLENLDKLIDNNNKKPQ